MLVKTTIKGINITYFLQESAQLPSISLALPGLERMGCGTTFFTEALALCNLSMNSPRFSANKQQNMLIFYS